MRVVEIPGGTGGRIQERIQGRIQGRLLEGILGIVATVLMVGGAAAQDRCRSDDLVCRIDRLEANVERILNHLEGQGRHGGRRSEPRSVSMPVNQSCSGDGCVSLAAEFCRTSGFARGVPAEIQADNFGFSRMTRVTCMD